MGANPTTDQFLAQAREARIPHLLCGSGGCDIERNEQAWITELQKTLPDIDPKIIGQVLLHAGTLMPRLTEHHIFALMPKMVPAYQQQALRDLGADLLDPRTGITTDTPAAGA